MAPMRLALFLVAAGPAAGMHGFLDSLFHRGTHANRDRHITSHGSLGSGALEALRLALHHHSTAESLKSVPNADKVFERYDADEAGPPGLSYDEARSLLSDLGFNQEEVQQMQREMDADHSGYIDKAEFNDYIEVPSAENKEQREEGGHGSVEHGSAESAERSTPREQEMVTTTPLGGVEQSQIRSAPAVIDAPKPSPPPPTPAWDPSQGYDESKQPQPVFAVDRAATNLQTVAGRTQDTLVDAVENAQVAEIKRSVFRSLARLRSAEVREYDTIARIETQVIDDYNDRHRYRRENPIRHMGDFDDPVGSDKYATFHSEDKEDDDI